MCNIIDVVEATATVSPAVATAAAAAKNATTYLQAPPRIHPLLLGRLHRPGGLRPRLRLHLPGGPGGRGREDGAPQSARSQVRRPDDHGRGQDESGDG